MSTDNSRNPAKSENNPQPAAGTGNASNPSPQNDLSSTEGSQLLNEKAEKYLREVASIEDVPDAQDQQEMDDALKKEDKK